MEENRKEHKKSGYGVDKEGGGNFIFGGSYSTIKDHLFYKYKDNDNYLKDKETVIE